MGALDYARATAHQSIAAHALAHDSLSARAHSALFRENHTIYQNARYQNYLSETVYGRHAIIEHHYRNSHIQAVQYRFGIPVRQWMRPDLLRFTLVQAALSPEELKEILLKTIELWKTRAKKSAFRFWGKLILILKKQEKIKQAVKSNFIPVKILFNSLRPIKFAA